MLNVLCRSALNIDFEFSFRLANLQHPARKKPQPTGPDRLAQPCVNFRSHSMPVNIPPRLGVLKKASFCAYRPTLPDELIERAQTVDGITPITAGRLGCTDEIAKPPEEL